MNLNLIFLSIIHFSALFDRVKSFMADSVVGKIVIWVDELLLLFSSLLNIQVVLGLKTRHYGAPFNYT